MAQNPDLRQLWRRTVTSGGGVASGLNRANEFQERAIANTAPAPNVSAPKPDPANDLSDLKNEISISETGAPAPKSAVSSGLARPAPIARDVAVPVAQPPVVVAQPVATGLTDPSATGSGAQIATIGQPVVVTPPPPNYAVFVQAPSNPGPDANPAPGVIDYTNRGVAPVTAPGGQVFRDAAGNVVSTGLTQQPTYPVAAPDTQNAPLVDVTNTNIATQFGQAGLAASADTSLNPTQLMQKYGAGDPQELWDALRGQGYSEADAYRMSGIAPVAGTRVANPAFSSATQTPASVKDKVTWAATSGRANWNSMSDAQKRALAGLPETATGEQLYGALTANGIGSMTDAAAMSGYVPRELAYTDNPFVADRVKGILKQYDAALSELNANTRGIVQAALRRQAEQGGDYGHAGAYESIERGIQAEGRAAMFDNIRRITTEREGEIADAVLDEERTAWDREGEVLDDLKEIDPDTYVQLVAARWERTVRRAGWTDEQVAAGKQTFFISAANGELEEDWLDDGKPKAGVDYTKPETQAAMTTAVRSYFTDDASATNFVNNWIAQNVTTATGGTNEQYVYAPSSAVSDDLRTAGLPNDWRITATLRLAKEYFADKNPANTASAQNAFVSWLTAALATSMKWPEHTNQVSEVESNSAKAAAYAAAIWTDFWAGTEG